MTYVICCRTGKHLCIIYCKKRSQGHATDKVKSWSCGMRDGGWAGGHGGGGGGDKAGRSARRGVRGEGRAGVKAGGKVGWGGGDQEKVPGGGG